MIIRVRDLILNITCFFMVVSCQSNDEAGKSRGEANVLPRESFVDEEVVRLFFDDNKGKSLTYIKSILWTPTEEIDNEDGKSIHYSFLTLEQTLYPENFFKEDLILENMSLNFVNNKFSSYDIGFISNN